MTHSEPLAIGAATEAPELPLTHASRCNVHADGIWYECPHHESAIGSVEIIKVNGRSAGEIAEELSHKERKHALCGKGAGR